MAVRPPIPYTPTVKKKDRSGDTEIPIVASVSDLNGVSPHDAGSADSYSGGPRNRPCLIPVWSAVPSWSNRGRQANNMLQLAPCYPQGMQLVSKCYSGPKEDLLILLKNTGVWSILECNWYDHLDSLCPLGYPLPSISLGISSSSHLDVKPGIVDASTDNYV